MYKDKILKHIIFILIIFILCPNLVNARNTGNDEICISTNEGSNFYKIKSKGSKVIPFFITYQDIEGNGKYPALCYCSGVGDNCLKQEQKKDSSGNLMFDTNNKPIMETTNECKNEYQFKVESQALSCKINNHGSDRYEFYICPSDASYDVVKKMQNGMKIEYVSSINQYKVTFSVPSNFKGKVSAKLVNKIIDKNGVSKFNINSTTGLPNSVLRNYSTSDVDNGIYFAPGTEFYFIFYLADASDGCNGERLGYIMGAVPSTVPNPMYNDSICTSFRSKYASGSVERIMVSDCDSDTIQYNELATIRNNILTKIEEVNKIHTMLETKVDTSNNFTCLFKNNSSTINQQLGFSTKTGFLDISGTGTYWKAFCTETISVEYDDPKAVKAGEGFGYNAKFVVNRTCTPVKISEPKYLPNCNYSVECWGGPANHHGENGAGPSEDFDNCVNTCDGGTYTQNCINSCYSKIYGKNVSYSSKTSSKDYAFLSASSSNYKALRLASNKGNTSLIGTTGGGVTNLPISSGCVISGNNIDNGCGTHCENASTCTSEHGITFTYLNSCNANGETTGTKCYEVYTNWPCDDRGIHYREDILASENEYNNVVAGIKEFSSSAISNEKYQIIVNEEYNKESNDKYKSKTTTFSNKDSENKISSAETKKTEAVNYQSSTNLADPTQGSLDADFINSHIRKDIYSYQISRTVEVGIGAAYVSKVNGNDVLYNQTNSSTDTSLDKNDKYYSAQNKYFTQFDTRVVNNYRNWPYYNSSITSDSTDSYTKNIHVRFYNIGSWNQWGTTGNGVNINCLYGTAPGLICNDKNDCPDDKEEGIRYIFRPINLTDVFPNNRNPRFNWTGTINKSTNTATGAAILKEKSLYNDAVDPETLIKAIESKGESIYDVSNNSSEIDYEFVLTRENIRNIRSYNKHVRDYNGDGEKNYLDYNMSCYKNSRGQEVCTSKFLDNINGNSGSEENSNFITYSVGGYGMTERKSIAGCNNAINGNECDTISK